MSVDETPNSGLLAIWAGIDQNFVTQYREWHNCEHIPERISIPGFLNGRRYRKFSDDPNFLMLYETEALNVLGSESYLAALNTPTDRSKASLAKFISPTRSTYDLIGEAGTVPELTSPYLMSLRFNLDKERESSLLAIYKENWLTALSKQDAISRARLFCSDETVSSIETSEQKIFSAGPGQRQYLALLEFNTPFQINDCPIDAITNNIFEEDSGRKQEIKDRFWLEIGYARPDPQVAPVYQPAQIELRRDTNYAKKTIIYLYFQ